jgi:HAD superfamily hydrolase (TIGR01509 family)
MRRDAAKSAADAAATDLQDQQGVDGLDAVLWDMDGTLVDTEPYWIEAEYALVAEHGGRWSEDHALALVGNPLLVSAEYLRTHGSVDLPPLEIVDRLQGHVVEQVRRAVHWRPGAVELLTELTAARVPCALVTMSWQPLADAVLAHLPAGTFDAVVTGDRVARGKPHPEPYATAAALLGVRAERCLAIEDSVTGLTSAEAAGVPTLGVPHLVPLPEGPSRTVRPTLEGIGIKDLAELVGAHDSVSEP